MSPVTHERSWSSTYSNMHRVLRRTQFCTSIIAVKKNFTIATKKRWAMANTLNFRISPKFGRSFSALESLTQKHLCNTRFACDNHVPKDSRSATRVNISKIGSPGHLTVLNERHWFVSCKNTYRKSQTTGRLYPVSNDCALLGKVISVSTSTPRTVLNFKFPQLNRQQNCCQNYGELSRN